MAGALAFFAVVARLAGRDKIFEGGLSFPKTLAAEFSAGLVFAMRPKSGSVAERDLSLLLLGRDGPRSQ
jgi:hypothetical protein